MSKVEAFLAQVKAREEKATAGPFYPDPRPRTSDNILVSDKGKIGFFEHHADAEFIVHARSDIPRLVKMVEAALAFVAPCMCRRGFESCGSCAFRRELDRLAGEKT